MIDSIKLVEFMFFVLVDSDVVVDVKVVGLNFCDIMVVINFLFEEVEEGDFWDNLGFEFVGIVCMVGLDVINFKFGDCVMG